MTDKTEIQAQVIQNHYKEIHLAIPVFDEIGMTAIEIQLLPIIGWMVKINLDEDWYDRIHYAMAVCPMCDFDEEFRVLYCVDTTIWSDQNRSSYGEGKEQLLTHFNECIDQKRARDRPKDSTLTLV